MSFSRWFFSTKIKPLSPVFLISHRFSPITSQYFHHWFKSHKSDFFENDFVGKYKESSDFFKGFDIKLCYVLLNLTCTLFYVKEHVFYHFLKRINKIGVPSCKLKSLENKRLNQRKCEHCPANCYLFKTANRNTRKMCEICSKLIIETPEWRHWRPSSVFMVNF